MTMCIMQANKHMTKYSFEFSVLVAFFFFFNSWKVVLF